MGILQSGLKLAGGVILAIAVATPAMPQEPDRRDPPPDVPAHLGAEAEARAMLPAPSALDMPILVYHHVVPGKASGSELARTLFVTPETFEQQLKYLQESGYQSVSFDEVADAVEYGAPLPERPVIISFDDGWENQYAYAFPLLLRYGFTATFFVVTNYLDHQNFMTMDQVQALLAAGMTIGDHTRSHPPLPSIGNPRRLNDEIAGSKVFLEERLGIPVDTFAYPYGSYTASVAAAVKAAGYRTARTVDSGTHVSPDNLETLPGIIFPSYISHYRAKVEVAAGDTKP